MNKNKATTAIFFLLSFLLATGISAKTVISGNTKKLIDPNASGKLQLIIGVGASPKYLEEWVSIAGSKPSGVDRIKECKPDQTVYIGFFVTGYALDQNKNVNCAVDVTIYKPNGQVLFPLPRYAKVKGRTKENGFLALDPALDLTFDSTDIEGTYKIMGIVTDNISNKASKSVYEIKLNKY